MITTQQKAALAIRDFTLSERALGQQLHAAQAQIATKNQVRKQLTIAAAAAGSSRRLHARWAKLWVWRI